MALLKSYVLPLISHSAWSLCDLVTSNYSKLSHSHTSPSPNVGLHPGALAERQVTATLTLSTVNVVPEYALPIDAMYRLRSQRRTYEVGLVTMIA